MVSHAPHLSFTCLTHQGTLAALSLHSRHHDVTGAAGCHGLVPSHLPRHDRFLPRLSGLTAGVATVIDYGAQRFGVGVVMPPQPAV
ncbi:unnamed protein product [Gadus morhua 'NCC']